MKHIAKLLMTTGLVLGVAACNSSPNLGSLVPLTTITPAEQAARNFADSDGNGTLQDAGGAVAAGKTLSARRVAVSGQNLNYTTGETGLASGGSATLKSNASGAITVTINGVEQVFQPSDKTADGFGYEVNASSASGGYYGVYSYTGPIDNFLSAGNGYAQVVEIQRDKKDPANPGLNERVFAVLGTETRDADLGALPTATYSGRSRTNVVPNTGFRSNSEDRIRVRSDVAMTADFGAGEISGTMSNFTRQDPGSNTQASVAGTVAMDSTSFNNNGFAGTLSPDPTFANNLNVDAGSGTYSGAFYGPDANEVAGVLSLSVTDGGTNFNGIGFFEADKQ